MDHNSMILEVGDVAGVKSLDDTVAVHDQSVVHDVQAWEDHVTKLEEVDVAIVMIPMLPCRLWYLHSYSLTRRDRIHNLKFWKSWSHPSMKAADATIEEEVETTIPVRLCHTTYDLHSTLLLLQDGIPPFQLNLLPIPHLLLHGNILDLDYSN